MIERKIYQCSYCRKMLVNKTYMKYHEEKCFRNPLTKSCATCIYFSQHFDPFYTPDEPYQCFAGKFKGTQEIPKPKLKTRCRKWKSFMLIEDYDLWENYDEVLDPLLSGFEKEFSKNLTKVIAKKEVEFAALFGKDAETERPF